VSDHLHARHKLTVKKSAAGLFWQATCYRWATVAACMRIDSKPLCIGVVLSAGGLRGAAHLGVLRRLVRHHIPVEVMVGVSAGAIIASYYAAVGLSVHEMIDQAPVFRGRHLLMHGLALRSPASLKPYLRRFCGIIPQRLEQLEAASFTTLHHGIKRLGIVCHDIDRNQPRYFSTIESRGVRLSDVARASAAVPGVLPAKTVMIGTDVVRLADGGISDSLPLDFVRSPLVGATHVIVSDCRYTVPAPPSGDDSLIYIRPDLDGIRPLRAPRTALMKAVWRGEAAVTTDFIDRIHSWMRVPVPAKVALG
jgi:predicted acylesterase/phospholipase RssA